MANSKSALKRLRSADRRQLRNRVYRGRARTAVRKAKELIDAGHLEEAGEATRAAIVALDKAAQKGIIRKNNAARRKSRLMRRLNQSKRAV